MTDDRHFLTVRVAEMRFVGMTSALISKFEINLANGEFASIIGPSGAGKTTLLRIIGGLETRFEGSIGLKGEAVIRPRREIQFVFQDNRLLPWKTAIDNVAFAHDQPQSREAQAIASHLLAEFGIAHRSRAWPKTLSGGEQSRISLARAIMAGPSLILLDEPFKGLDLRSRVQLSTALRSLLDAQRTAALMVTHDVDDALALSDRIILVSSTPMTPIKEFCPDFTVRRDRQSAGSSPLRAELVDYLTGSTNSTKP